MNKTCPLCFCTLVLLLLATAASTQEVPAEAKAHYEAGMAAKKAGDLKQAAAELQSAVELAPKWVDARWALAWTYAALKDEQRAVDQFNWVMHLAPGSKQAQEAKAAIERLGGRVQAPSEPAPKVTMANFEAWKSALSSPKDVQLRLHPKLNQIFMAGEGPSTPAEAVVEDIATCILQH